MSVPPPPLFRSIPACAGEPRLPALRRRRRRVYPRVCGGTSGFHAGEPSSGGLSPRVRGNRSAAVNAAAGQGSIPACAGEPSGIIAAVALVMVYPRVCGGTHAGPGRQAARRGLSPRVRGNHCSPPCPAFRPRSIPACAGEPRWASYQRAWREVYPRVCGGTAHYPALPAAARGLSPRVRGNRRRPGRRPQRQGSIPACAGEPRCTRPLRKIQRVYPRVCGGTIAPGAVILMPLGLSPRVRGNRRIPAEQFACARSIPACAGEPGRPRGCQGRRRVYPRVCGGTGGVGVSKTAEEGLSPRVRGNPPPPP